MKSGTSESICYCYIDYPMIHNLHFTIFSFWFCRQPRSMPACHHPDTLTLATVEEAIGRNNYLTKGEIWNLRNEAAGLRESR